MSANDGVHGQELWVSDGTESGTHLIDILPGPAPSNPSGFYSVGSTCYFVTRDGIWKTQGTTETTSKASDLIPTTYFTKLNNWIYFGANSDDYGNELFKLKAKTNQTISFDELPSKKVGDASFAISASSSSGLPLTFEISDTNVVQLVDGKLNILSAGTVTITASQSGNDDYEPAVSVSKTLVIETVTGISKEEVVKVYPNPTSQTVNLYVPYFDGSGSVTVINTSGKTVLELSQMDAESVLDLSTVPAGVYIVKLGHASKQQVTKVVKL